MDLFENSALLYYKHLSGEFNTASGFSTFMACHILKTQEIPNVMMINDLKKRRLKTFYFIIIWVEMIIVWFCWKSLVYSLFKTLQLPF